jgi:hypothetical protein
MAAPRIDLDSIEVPIPCQVQWDSMSGAETVRLMGVIEPPAGAGAPPGPSTGVQPAPAPHQPAPAARR